MENRIKKKVTSYINQFKDDIVTEMNSLQLNSDGNTERVQKLAHYVTTYTRLNLLDDDFSKRKRVKNHVPQYDRCTAKRADGCQCTRRKKDSDNYCGTHLKGTPHGEIMQSEGDKKKKVELTIINDKGISHYVDANGKQFSAEMVMNCK
jgi:hypothetical protein